MPRIAPGTAGMTCVMAVEEAALDLVSQPPQEVPMARGPRGVLPRGEGPQVRVVGLWGGGTSPLLGGIDGTDVPHARDGKDRSPA
jgi:hypothetical protein